MAEQRIDKWLWFARIFKTRSLATKFVSTGDIRLSRKPQSSLVRIHKSGARFCDKDARISIKPEHVGDSKNCKRTPPNKHEDDKAHENFTDPDPAQTHRIDKPKTLVKAGDVLSFMLHNRLRVLEIVDCGSRRGPAREAQMLYRDHSPPPPTKQEKDMNGIPIRDIGSGRPTKKERRAMDAWKNNQE